MQCMQYLKINYIDATSFANLLLRNTCISFCTSPDSPSLDTWASLAFGKNFAIRDGELTPSRQNKGTSFFVMPSIFRNFASAEVTCTRK